MRSVIADSWNSRRTLWLLFIAWAACVTFLSSIPGDSTREMPFQIPHLDKMIHFMIYMTGGILLSRALHLGFGISGLKLFCVTISLLLLFGILDELHQTFVPMRSGGDPGDMAADFLGALCGAATTLIIHAKQRNCHGAR